MPKLKTKSGKVKHYKYTKKGVAAYKKAKKKSKKT
jgi:ribosomal protein L35